MDVLVTTFLIGVLVFVVGKISAILINYAKMCKKLRKLPQLPSHWLSGNLDILSDPNSYMNTSQEMAKKGHRMYCLWVGPFPICGVCHPETVKQALQNTSEKAMGLADGYRFIQQWIGDGLLVSVGKKWERNRKMLTPAFHFDILKGYIPIMNHSADILMDKLWEKAKSGASVEVMEKVRKQTLDIMLKCSLSYDADIQNDEKEDHPYLVAVRRLNKLIWERLLNPFLFFDFLFYLSPLGREYKKCVDISQKFSGRIIRDRKKVLQSGVEREKRHLDFLDILLTVRDDEGVGLSDQEIQDEVDTFTFEGHDTTMSAISWSIHALAKHPGIQELVYEDVDCALGDSEMVDSEALGRFVYLNCFIREVLRYYSVVQDIARTISKPFCIDGVEIPVGPRLDIPITAIHHNPEIWPDHMDFRPERFDRQLENDKDPYGFIPFSVGSRNCIGRNFAMNEIKITVAKFVQRFKATLDPKHDARQSVELVLSSKDGIRVHLQKRLR